MTCQKILNLRQKNEGKKDVLVIFGGHNTEYYASCDSVGGMLDYIDGDIFNVLKIGVTIEGDWILTNASSDEIKDGISWLKRKDNKRAIISPERNRNNILVFSGSDIIEQHIDCVFPLISGYGGEDGTLQGLLEIANIPYVGSNTPSSANSMDKALTRLFADKCGLKQPECIVLYKKEYENKKGNLGEKIDFGYPVFVKPASLGSSVGLSKVDDASQLHKAVETAFNYENKILIEQGIEGKEIKVAVLGNDDLIMGEVCELTVPKGAVNDYATKHISFTSTKKIPAEISEELKEEAKRQAGEIFKILECKGFARVDFFLTDSDELYFNEINTVPGIGKHSIYSVMFEKAGIPLKEVLSRLIILSFENSKQVNETNKEKFEDFLKRQY
ncbi:MAG: D-alanine--D-alanine ligase family protein [Anaerovoracaceae bacterium]